MRSLRASSPGLARYSTSSVVTIATPADARMLAHRTECMSHSYGSCRSLWSWWRVRIGMPAFVGLLGLVLVAASPQGPGLAVRMVAPGRGDDGVTQLSQQLRQGDRDQSERGEVTVSGALPHGSDGEECVGEQAEGGPAVPGGPAGDLAAVQGGGLFGQLVIFLDGLIANGKFCCVRRVQLSLTWWHRPLRLRGSALHTDVAVVGEPDDPDLDRLPSVQPAPGR